jgi:KUP system potassium uptake protein
LLVVVFRSSSNLASAYGVAVNTSMVVDTMLASCLLLKARPCRSSLLFLHCLPFFAIETTFLAANGLKLAKGGYMPVLIGSTIILLMVIWMRGRFALAAKLRRESIELIGLLN